jgi:hypothetical protein
LQLAPIRERIDVIGLDEQARAGMPSAKSAVADAAELETIGDRATDWLQYTRMKAGATGSDGGLLVDGVPSMSLPPAAAIARISINDDPFSAEYMTPGENQLNVTTRGPARTFHWSISGASLNVGGDNPLVPHESSTAGSLNLGVSGGLPSMPVTFSRRCDWQPSGIAGADPRTLDAESIAR